MPGGNYGWDPAQGGTVGGYDESVPMTDLERFPDAVPAAWSSGSPVEATCRDAAFLPGRSGASSTACSRWPRCAAEAAADDGSARTAR